MRSSPRQRGFTVVEVLVVVAILAIVAAIAVPSIAAAMRVSAYKSTVTTVVNRLGTLRAQAAKGSQTEFDITEIVLEHRTMAVNPAGTAPPDGYPPADHVVFQGRSGYCYVGTDQRPAAIVIANSSDASEAYAILIGSTSSITAKRKTPTGWEDYQ